MSLYEKAGQFNKIVMDGATTLGSADICKDCYHMSRTVAAKTNKERRMCQVQQPPIVLHETLAECNRFWAKDTVLAPINPMQEVAYILKQDDNGVWRYYSPAEMYRLNHNL